MRNLLFDYKDKVVCDLLEFGFPLSFKGNVKDFPQLEVWKYKNHRGAIEFQKIWLNFCTKKVTTKPFWAHLKQIISQTT